jgi:hypothetical protein
MNTLRKWLTDLPTTPLVIVIGLLIAIVTTARYVSSEKWVPSEGWLMFVLALVGVNFAVKRFSHKESPPSAEDK